MNEQGKTIQDLVAEGQLTEEQYANLINTVNGMLKSGEVDRYDLSPELRAEVDTLNNKIDKGEVTVADINKNKGKLDQTYMSEEFLQQMTGGTPINATPADGSITENKLDSNVRGAIKGIILEKGTNANNVTSTGAHFINTGSYATEVLNFPPGQNFGVLEVWRPGLNIIFQKYTDMYTGKVWVRNRYLGNWREWVDISEENSTQNLGTTDLNTLTDDGEYRQIYTPNISDDLNYPPITDHVKTGILKVNNYGGSISQIYIADRASEIWTRDRNVEGAWYDWGRIGGTNGGSTISGNIIPRTDMEITGRWTSNDAGDQFMFEMGNHELVEIIEVGRSVRDRPIYAAVIGDPSKPAYYINAASHGTEVGAAEAAWLLVREFTQEKSLMFMDMCIIILPNQNPDNRFVARGNKNGIDINRDWVDQEQPETHAAMHILNNYNVVAATDLHNFGYPRHVSLKEAIYGTPEVMAKSQELFDLVTTTLENDDQLVRRYDPEAPNSSFTNGVAEQWNVATLLIEIPCGGYNDWTFDHYYPTPYWQAYVGGLACKSIARHVWKNLDTFVALKSES